MKRIGLLVLVGVWAVLGFAQDSVQMDLRTAFEQVAALEGFEALSQSDVEGITGFQLGKCEGTVHGNASHRDEVLQIFSALPADALYSEEVTSKNKIPASISPPMSRARAVCSTLSWASAATTCL